LFSDTGDSILIQEDVGRHNAVDKVIGQSFLESMLPLDNYILTVSGRTSFEIMQKALVARVSVVVAVGAPSSLAVDLAEKFGMTLLGFTSRDSFNVYTGAERVRG
jgi:FdhD protein